MDFLLLGPVEVVKDGVPVPLGRRQERCLLGLLLLEAGRPVPVDRLLDLLWDGSPPGSARGTVQTYVSRLRAHLGPHGVPLLTRHNGYVMDVDPQRVDMHRFAAAVAEGQRVPDPDRRCAVLTSALALWRGPLLAGAADDRLRRRVGVRWYELRLRAAEAIAADDLTAGRYGKVVTDLVDLAAEHPTREHLAALRMTALYRDGRQVEALDIYREIRQMLVAQFGIEPGAELQRLHGRVLRGAPPAPLRTLPPGRSTLPRDIADFTGRGELLHRLQAAIRSPRAADATAPVIVTIDGMAGAGKTTLAVHLAHRLAENYPDGQFYLDLHGHSHRAPLGPAAALDTLLRQLGVPGEQIPESTGERAALWRRELADRRVLLVLDNAGRTEQLLPLLPYGSLPAAVVTSRRRLTGLDGATPVSLDVLTDAEATALLRRVIGARVDDEPDEALAAARLCGNLALALRLAAAKLVHRPGWKLSDLVAFLRQAGLVGDLEIDGRSVSAAFDLSYRDLSPPARRLFRVLGLHPGPDIDAHAVASAAQLDPPAARRVAGELVDAHMLLEPAAGRFRLHGLLREYATRLAGRCDSEPERDAAPVGRLLPGAPRPARIG